MDPRLRYLCIDLKSFYASAECAARGLDPFATNLVVADPSRGPGALCLAVSPAMRALGVPNRCRVRDIPQGMDYIMAPPRMRHYMQVSAQIYAIYLRWFSPADVHVYSVDECFVDVGPSFARLGADALGMAPRLMDAVLAETGICATAGVGTNLFLAKVALDVLAKHEDSHVGVLDEESYKLRIWPHRPITDVWGVGAGTARRLAALGARCMGEVALMDEAVLRREFGVQGEVLHDHAWGIEPCTMAQIKAFRPRSHSKGSSQILPRDYAPDEARVVLREMAEASSLGLVEEGLACDGVRLQVGFSSADAGPGWPSGAGGSCALSPPTSSRAAITAGALGVFDACVGADRLVRRLSLALAGLVDERDVQPSLLGDLEARERERCVAEAQVAVRRRFGKNALVHGTSLLPCATGRERNVQVGGHHE